jgi:hypothetical protein
MKKNWNTEFIKGPGESELANKIIDSRCNQFVHGYSWKTGIWPQLGGAKLIGKNPATTSSRVLMCGWPATCFGRLNFFSLN